MATLTVQDIVTTGLEATFASAAGGGDKWLNSGYEFVRIINGDASDKTVTFTAQHACNFGSTHNLGPITVTAGEQRDIGPFRTDQFNDSTGFCNITYSAVTSVTVAVIKFKP